MEEPEKERYFKETVQPLATELVCDVLRAMPEDPESFMIQWLRQRAPNTKCHAMSLRRRNATLKEELFALQADHASCDTKVGDPDEVISVGTLRHIVQRLRGDGFTEEEFQGMLLRVPFDSLGQVSCRVLTSCLQDPAQRPPRNCEPEKGPGAAEPAPEVLPAEEAASAEPSPQPAATPAAGKGKVEGPPAKGKTTAEAGGIGGSNAAAAATALQAAPAPKEYDLADKSKLADFLEDADIRLEGGPGSRRISEDALRVIVRNLKGDRFTVEMLQGILQEVDPDCEGLLSCRDLARCLRRADPASEPEESKHYDLAQKKGLADFLKHADIRLVRAEFILKLQREGLTALVTHEEVQAWADGEALEGTQIVSLSHCWESREHCDPYGYQVAKLATALKGKEWLFIDYVSLYQFQRLSQKQNVSFRRAMQHMHVLYCHEKSSTLRIESLTPEGDIAEAERKQDCVMMYHHPSGLVKPVPVTELVKNHTPYAQRGWCAAEREWSSTRAATNLSREVDAPEGEKGGSAPMVPEAFRENVAHQLKFTHLDDVETVCRLQAEVYQEKAEMCKSLRLVDLGATALDIALSALKNYPQLESLEIVQCELSSKLPLLLQVADGKKLRRLHLQSNELAEEGIRQIFEALALQPNGALAALSLSHDCIGVAGVEALAEALRTSALIELSLSHMCLDSDGVGALAEAIKQTPMQKKLSLAGEKLAEEDSFALLEALRVSGVQLDLADSDLSDAAMAMARAVRTSQVKGQVTHPVVDFLVELEDEKFKDLEEKQTLVVGSFQELLEPLHQTLTGLPLRELKLDDLPERIGPGTGRGPAGPNRPGAPGVGPAFPLPGRGGGKGPGLRLRRADEAADTLVGPERE
ncbi:Nlrp4a [Symbiodinium sp. CCMP2592]|nr:Nlrp4a [Symbiodinium sp. CCMP2592]